MEEAKLLSDDGESDSDKYAEQTDTDIRPLPHRQHHNQWKRCCKLLHLASFVAALGGILFGYDIGIVSGALLQLREHFKLTCFQQEMVVTSLIIGGLLASIVGGQIVDHFGRRRAIIVNALFFILGAFVLAFSTTYAWLIMGRLVLGFAVSLSAIGECIYISEIAPPARRGFLVSLNELGITVGILLAYLVNYLLIKTEFGWRIMFGLSVIPAFLQGFGMIFLPSSPRWLISKQLHLEAKDVISSLWPYCDVGHQMQKLKNSLRDEKEYKLTDLFTKKENLGFRMFIGCGIVFFQQITGQPTVLYYAPAVFQSMGFGSSTSATLATVGLGIVKVIFTMLALTIVDRVGRRTLLLIGVVTMTCSVITLSAVTRQVDYLPSRNPCDSNFIGAGHTYISVPAYRLIDHCHEQASLNRTSILLGNNTASSIVKANGSFSNHGSVFATTRRSILTDARTLSTSNETYARNCTKHHRHIGVHQIHRYPPSVKYLCLIALMVFVVGYAIGFGPISWLILTEIFPVGIKGRAVATATVFNWGTNIITSLTFLDVITSIGPSYTFLVYSMLGCLAVIFIYAYAPETKCKTLEQISDDLSKRSLCCLRVTSCCNKNERFQVEPCHQVVVRSTTSV